MRYSEYFVARKHKGNKNRSPSTKMLRSVYYFAVLLDHIHTSGARVLPFCRDFERIPAWRRNRVIFGKVNETRWCFDETPNVQCEGGKVKIGPVLQKGSTGAQLASRGPVCLFLFVFLVEISSFSLERRLCVATTKLLVSLFGFENSEKRCGVMPLSESDTRIAADNRRKHFCFCYSG